MIAVLLAVLLALAWLAYDDYQLRRRVRSLRAVIRVVGR